MPCSICGAACEEVIDFGLMPIANGFLAPEDVGGGGEERFPLVVVACPSCRMVQLAHPVPPEKLFPAEYAFHSSTSAGMAAHFEAFAASILSGIAGRVDPFVVEIGSNDGIFLRHIAAAGVRHIGVEPAANVAAVARGNGVQTISRFFDRALAEEILRTHGAADVIVAANVMCHIPDLHGVVRGIARLLKPGGILVFEDPYLGDILDQVAFDQIYDEHVYYFSLASLQYLFEVHGFEVVDVVAQGVHGGSMRYVVGSGGRRRPSAAVDELEARERRLALRNADTYARFRRGVITKRDALMSLLGSVRAAGKRVVGYAATSKSTTAIVYCGITTEMVEYICDTTPGKQGLLSPGAHIPIRSHAEFAGDTPDYALLFAWNHRTEVLAKEQAFLQRGGRFITYVPEVGFIE
jgi:methylation protein EvaC